jgi:bifunctional non-homologous end joining protein LigD
MSEEPKNDGRLTPSETPAPYKAELHSTEGGSDKIYMIEIVEVAGAFEVNYANGPRGRTLTYGTKTTSPVSWAAAAKITKKILNEKLGKGYRPIGGTIVGAETGESTAAVRPNDTGFRPQLLNSIDLAQAKKLILNCAYFAQEKYHGERRTIRVEAGVVTGINRKGLSVPVSPKLSAAALHLSDNLLIDGELMNDNHFVAFELLGYGGAEYRSLPASERMTRMSDLIIKHIDDGDYSFADKTGEPGVIIMAATAFTPGFKQDLFDRVQAAGLEGVVFKEMSASYQSGRPNSGGPALKWKFYESLSAVVVGANPQRSVQIALYEENGNLLRVGNVTIPSNADIPPDGSIIDVRYRYANLGGALYEPVYEQKRDDIDVRDCVASQRKFRAADQLAA